MTEKQFNEIKRMLDEYLPKTDDDFYNFARNNLERNYFQQLLGSMSLHPQILMLDKLRAIVNYIYHFTGGAMHPDSIVGSAAIALRVFKSLNISINEIMVQVEQAYWFTALGTLRRCFELVFVSDMCKKYGDDFYGDALLHGVNNIYNFEMFFGPEVTDETIEVKAEIDKRYERSFLDKPYGWVLKYDKTFSGVTKYFEGKLGPTLNHALKMSHNLNHYSTFVLAIDDKPEMYKNMASYAIYLVISTVFRITKLLLANLMKEFDNNIDLLKESELYRVKKLMKLLDEFIDQNEYYFDELDKEYEKRRNESIGTKTA